MIYSKIFSYNLIVFCLLYSYNISCYAAWWSDTKSVIVKGYGDTESAALNNAKKTAIGKVCGETIVGSTSAQIDTQKNIKLNSSGSNSKSFSGETKTKDENLILTSGTIKSFKVVNKGKESDNIFIEIDAQVTECKNSDTLQKTFSNKEIISELQRMNSEMKLLNSSGLILDPKTLAQRYHNARLLQQRGEIDLALKTYEEIVKEKILFADPIQDIVILSKRVYGLDGSKKYIESTLSHLKGRPEYYYGMQLVDDDNPIPNVWNIATLSLDTFPPFAYLYLSAMNKKCFSELPLKMNTCIEDIIELDGFDIYQSKLINKLKSGENINFYIDSNRAETTIALDKNSTTVMRNAKYFNEKMKVLKEKLDTIK